MWTETFRASAMRYGMLAAVRFRFALLVVLVPLIAAALMSCTNYKVVKKGELNPRAFRDVQERTADTRGLPFKEDVDAVVYTKKESGAYFEKTMTGTDDRARRDDLVAHRLGLLPRDKSLRDIFKQALTQNAAGVYTPAPQRAVGEAATEGTVTDEGRGRLFIVTDTVPQPARAVLNGFGYLTGTDWANALFLSHELTHALQDQHFDLSRVVPPGLYGANEDMAIARKSIVESEANLVAQAYLLGVKLDSWVQRNSLIEYLALGRVLDVWLTEWMNPDIPPFYVKVLVEQYTQGMKFLQHVVNDGGWGAVNQAYAGALPMSTEQLIWPEKLFDEAELDPPQYLPEVDLSASVFEGYERIDGNVFGALLFRILLEEHVSSSAASEVAYGWGGDRYDVIESPERSMLVWRSVWDTEADAAEYIAAYSTLLGNKYPSGLSELDHAGATVFIVEPAETGGALSGRPEAIAIARDGARVVIVEGAAPSSVDALLAALWPQTEPRDDAAPQFAPRGPADPVPTRFVRRKQAPLRRHAFLPHHTLALRLGGQVNVDAQDGTRPGLGFDREFRWGFRKNLEWTPPYLFRVHVPMLTERVDLAVTLGFDDLALIQTSGGGVGIDTRPVVGSTLTWHFTDTLAGALQARSEARWSTDLTLSSDILFGASATVFAAPFERLVSALGMGLESRYRFEDKLGFFSPNEPRGPDRVLLTIGAVQKRGRARQPLFEIRLVDDLHFYALSVLYIDPVAREFLAHQHAAGLLLYF